MIAGFSQIKFKKLVKLANNLAEVAAILKAQSTSLEDKTAQIEVWTGSVVGKLTEINSRLNKIENRIKILEVKCQEITK